MNTVSSKLQNYKLVQSRRTLRTSKGLELWASHCSSTC